jgi:hypothetical protein
VLSSSTYASTAAPSMRVTGRFAGRDGRRLRIVGSICGCLFIVVAGIWLFRDYLLGRVTFVGDSDRLNTYLSILVYQVRTLKGGGLEAWDPLMFMGLNTYGLAYTFPNPLTYIVAEFPIESLFRQTAAITCALLVAAGLSAYFYISDVVGDRFASIVGSTMYFTSAFAVLKTSQEDMSLAPIMLVPVGLGAIRKAHRQAGKSLLVLCLAMTPLLYFTFLQQAAYGGLLMLAYAAHRAARTHTPVPLLTFLAAGIVSVTCALPRLITVAHTFGELQRSMAGAGRLTFDQVYAFQNVQPIEFLRWLDDGIFGRFPSEVLALGNNLNLHEGLLLYSSTFGTLLIVCATVRFRGGWFRMLRATRDDIAFHFWALVVVLAIVLVKPVQQVIFQLFLQVDFSHARVVIAGLLPMSVLGAVAVRDCAGRRRIQAMTPALVALRSGAPAMILAALVIATVNTLALRHSATRIGLADGPTELASEAIELLAGRLQQTAPKVPDGVRMLEVSRTAMHLGWNDVPRETRYEVERSSGDSGMEVPVSIGLANSATYWIDNLVPGQTYTFRVRACNDVACSDYSAAVVATTVEVTSTSSAPFAPTDVRVVADSTTHLWVEWAGAPGVEAYRIDMQRGLDGDDEEIGSAPGVASSYEVNDVGPGQTFVFRIRACARDQCSTYSAQAAVTTPLTDGAHLPQPPRGLTVTGTQPGQLTAVWQPVDGVSDYDLELKSQDAGTFTRAAARSVALTETLVSGLQPDTTYLLRVRVCAGGVCSVPSNVVQVTTPRAVDASAVPLVQNAWLLPTEFARVLWSIVAMIVFSFVLVFYRNNLTLRQLLAQSIGLVIIVEGLAYADLQLNGEQNRSSVPFAQGNLLVAGPREFGIPSGADLEGLRQRLEVDAYRSTLVCDPVQFQAFCAPYVAHAWGLRVAEGYSSGIPTRLGLLPWPGGAVSLRAISFGQDDQISWRLASLLNVKYVVDVNHALYENLAAEGQSDQNLLFDSLIVHQNPMPVVPRAFFSANVTPVPDAPTAVARIFPVGGGDASSDVQVQSFAEGWAAARQFDTTGSIDIIWRGDSVDVTLDDANASRFLVLNELYDSDWRAAANGSELRIYPTNAVMRGVVVPAHVTHVTFTFRPFFNAVTALASLLAALTMFVFLWQILRRCERGTWIHIWSGRKR